MCVSQRRWTGYRGPRSPGLPLTLLLLLPLSFLSSTPPLAQGAIHIPDNCEYSSTSTSTCSPLSTSSQLISIQTQTIQRCSCHTHTPVLIIIFTFLLSLSILITWKFPILYEVLSSKCQRGTLSFSIMSSPCE